MHTARRARQATWRCWCVSPRCSRWSQSPCISVRSARRSRCTATRKRLRAPRNLTSSGSGSVVKKHPRTNFFYKTFFRKLVRKTGLPLEKSPLENETLIKNTQKREMFVVNCRLLCQPPCINGADGRV